MRSLHRAVPCRPRLGSVVGFATLSGQGAFVSASSAGGFRSRYLARTQ